MTRTLLFSGLLTAVLTGCAASGVSVSPETDAASTSPANALRVETAVLQPSPAVVNISIPGEVTGSRDVVLSAALGGFVEARRAEAGDVVRQGQVLALVDHSTYAAGLDLAEAQLAQVQAERARLDKMGDFVTDQQLVSADTQVKQAQAQRDQAAIRKSRSVIKAPFSGTVASINAEPGSVTNPGTPIARMVKLDPIKVTLSVPDRDVVSLRKGMPVKVTTAATSKVFEGTITHIGAAADLSTRTFMVEAELPNPDGALLPGMIARINAQHDLGESTLIVPQDWIVTNSAGQGMFVEKGGVAEWHPVELGAILRDQVVVESGVAPGDHIVINGHRTLVQGDPLIIARQGVCCEAGRAVFEEAK